MGCGSNPERGKTKTVPSSVSSAILLGSTILLVLACDKTPSREAIAQALRSCLTSFDNGIVSQRIDSIEVLKVLPAKRTEEGQVYAFKAVITGVTSTWLGNSAFNEEEEGAVIKDKFGDWKLTLNFNEWPLPGWRKGVPAPRVLGTGSAKSGARTTGAAEQTSGSSVTVSPSLNLGRFNTNMESRLRKLEAKAAQAGLKGEAKATFDAQVAKTRALMQEMTQIPESNQDGVRAKMAEIQGTFVVARNILKESSGKSSE